MEYSALPPTEAGGTVFHRCSQKYMSGYIKPMCGINIYSIQYLRSQFDSLTLCM